MHTKLDLAISALEAERKKAGTTKILDENLVNELKNSLDSKIPFTMLVRALSCLAPRVPAALQLVQALLLKLLEFPANTSASPPLVVEKILTNICVLLMPKMQETNEINLVETALKILAKRLSSQPESEFLVDPVKSKSLDYSLIAIIYIQLSARFIKYNPSQNINTFLKSLELKGSLLYWHNVHKKEYKLKTTKPSPKYLATTSANILLKFGLTNKAFIPIACNILFNASDDLQFSTSFLQEFIISVESSQDPQMFVQIVMQIIEILEPKAIENNQEILSLAISAVLKENINFQYSRILDWIVKNTRNCSKDDPLKFCGMMISCQFNVRKGKYDDFEGLASIVCDSQTHLKLFKALSMNENLLSMISKAYFQLINIVSECLFESKNMLGMFSRHVCSFLMNSSRGFRSMIACNARMPRLLFESAVLLARVEFDKENPILAIQSIDSEIEYLQASGAIYGGCLHRAASVLQIFALNLPEKLAETSIRSAISILKLHPSIQPDAPSGPSKDDLIASLCKLYDQLASVLRGSPKKAAQAVCECIALVQLTQEPQETIQKTIEKHVKRQKDDIEFLSLFLMDNQMFYSEWKSIYALKLKNQPRDEFWQAWKAISLDPQQEFLRVYCQLLSDSNDHENKKNLVFQAISKCNSSLATLVEIVLLNSGDRLSEAIEKMRDFSLEDTFLFEELAEYLKSRSLYSQVLIVYHVLIVYASEDEKSMLLVKIASTYQDMSMLGPASVCLLSSVQNPEQTIAYGKFLLETGRLAECEQVLEQINPQEPRISYKYCQSLLRLGQGRAIDALRHALDGLAAASKASEYYTFQYMGLMSEILMYLGLPSDSEKCAKDALQTAQEISNVLMECKFNTQLGKLHRLKKQSTDSLKFLETKNDTESSEALWRLTLLCESLIEFGSIDQALDLYNTACQLLERLRAKMPIDYANYNVSPINKLAFNDAVRRLNYLANEIDLIRVKCSLLNAKGHYRAAETQLKQCSSDLLCGPLKSALLSERSQTMFLALLGEIKEIEIMNDSVIMLSMPLVPRKRPYLDYKASKMIDLCEKILTELVEVWPQVLAPLKLCLAGHRLIYLQAVKIALQLPSTSVYPILEKACHGVSYRYLEQVLKMDFKEKTHDLNTINLPELWTVVCLSIDVESKSLIVSFRRSNEKITSLRIPLTRHSLRSGNEQFTDLHSVFSNIIKENEDMLKLSYTSQDEKILWWNKRTKMDKDLFNILAKIEKLWFGAFRGILNGATFSESCNFIILLTKFLQESLLVQWKSNFYLPKAIVDSWLWIASRLDISDLDLEDMAYFILDECQRQGSHVLQEDHFDKLVDFLSNYLHSNSHGILQSCVLSNHIVLVLDRNLHDICWESMSSLHGASVSRVLSTSMLARLLESYPTGTVSVADASVYYVLNPSGDLVSTQETLMNEFSGLGWTGSIGTIPSHQEYRDCFESSDIFLYFGHGGGESIFKSKQLVQMPKCPRIAFLMGCSSGKLHHQGDFDPSGVPVYYLLNNNVTTLVANLWDVTDKDIDKFSLCVLRRFGLVKKPLKTIDLSLAVAKSRADCRFTYLNGAAPVIYGLPCFLQNQSVP